MGAFWGMNAGTGSVRFTSYRSSAESSASRVTHTRVLSSGCSGVAAYLDEVAVVDVATLFPLLDVVLAGIPLLLLCPSRSLHRLQTHVLRSSALFPAVVARIRWISSSSPTGGI